MQLPKTVQGNGYGRCIDINNGKFQSKKYILPSKPIKNISLRFITFIVIITFYDR